MGPVRALILLLLLAPFASAQPGRPPAIRIVVREDGMYRVGCDRLAKHLELNRLRPNDLGLFRQGRAVPMLVQGGSDGSLQRSDAIVFYGEAGRGTHTRSASYVLRLTRSPRRIRRLQNDRVADAVDEAWREVSVEADLLFQPLATVEQAALRGEEPLPSWFWETLAAPEAGAKEATEDTSLIRRFELQPAPRSSAPARIHLDVMGPPVSGVPQRLLIKINGRSLPVQEWDTPLLKTLTINVPPGVLQAKNRLETVNLSPAPTYEEPDNEVDPVHRNRLFIDRARLTYLCLLAGPGRPREQIVYRLPRALNRDVKTYRIANRYREGFDLYDVQRGAFIQPKQISLSPRGETVFCCVGSGSYLEADEVVPLKKAEEPIISSGADYVVVTVPRFRKFLKPLLRLREAQGLKTMVLDTREVFDTFNHGDFSPAAITAFVRRAHRSWKTKPRYLLLVGDADLDVDWLSKRETLPTNLVRTDYNGLSATDALFGDLDDDGIPEVSVGRLPARSPDDIVSMVKRIVALETEPSPGPWRRDLRFVAGEAHFGKTIDAVLERTFRSILAKEIPAGYRIGLTYASPASPFFWPPEDFSNHVLQGLEEGALAFTYVGHGSSLALDDVRIGKQRFPILNATHVPNVRTGGRTPLMTLIACWTGEFDHPDQDSLAELLVRSPQGPVAVVAASRISHPFPDALLGQALIQSLLRDRRPLGPMLDDARRGMIEGAKGPLALVARPFLSKAIRPATLVKDHVWLYNLLGDPAMRLPFPASDLTVETGVESVKPGETLDVTVKVPDGAAGTVTISLDVPAGWVDPTVTAPGLESPEAEARIIMANRQMNRRSLLEVAVPIDGGVAKVKLPVPAGISCSRLSVVAYHSAPGADSMGVTEVRVATQ